MKRAAAALGAALAAAAPALATPQDTARLAARVEECWAASNGARPGAHAFCTKVMEEAAALGEVELQARALAWRAWLNLWLQRWDDSLADGRGTLSLLGARPDSNTGRAARLAMGMAYRELGDASRSLSMIRDALARSRAAGAELDESICRAYLARTLNWVGDAQAARDEATQALALARKLRHPLAEMTALFALAMVEFVSGRHAETVPPLQAAIALARLMKMESWEVTFRFSLASERLALGQLAQAEAELDAAAPLLALVDNPSARDNAKDSRAEIAFAKGHYREAARGYAELIGGSSSNWKMRDALLGRARALAKAGDAAEARAAYQDAIRFVEGTRVRAGEQEQRTSWLAANGDAYRELVALLWDSEGPAAAESAFAVAEAGRARALSDAANAAGIAERKRAGPLTASEVRAALAPGELLVEYVQADDRLFAFALSRAGLRWAELPIRGARDLEARVGFFRALVQEADEPAALAAAGQRLYRELLQPALPPEGAAVLILSPDGPLHHLPFEALGVPGAVPARLLAEVSMVRYLPSGSLLARGAPAEAPAAPLLAVGDPAAQVLEAGVVPAAVRARLGPLPRSAREARSAAAALGAGSIALVGQDATLARLRALKPELFRILHFATHAFSDDTLPLRSALVLAASPGEDSGAGLLRASEVYGLALRAELVVLSACQTAAGPVSGSEGVQSLARAFLHAGAQAVLATRWDIADRHGGELMERFYRQLAAGADAARALSLAQRELIAAGAPPRAWAAFVLTGKPAPGVVPTNRLRFWLAGAALLAALGVASVRFAQRRPPSGG